MVPNTTEYVRRYIYLPAVRWPRVVEIVGGGVVVDVRVRCAAVVHVVGGRRIRRHPAGAVVDGRIEQHRRHGHGGGF